MSLENRADRRRFERNIKKRWSKWFSKLTAKQQDEVIQHLEEKLEKPVTIQLDKGTEDANTNHKP